MAPTSKLIDMLEKKVDEVGETLGETLRTSTDNVKSRVSGMRARVDTYLQDSTRRNRRRDSHQNLTAVKGK